ncbi:MAG: septum formation initiator family protein [Coriobacteriia bacterium]|nr:septum formation initiator family protein [Coriobacteriia bacterium]
MGEEPRRKNSPRAGRTTPPPRKKPPAKGAPAKKASAKKAPAKNAPAPAPAPARKKKAPARKVSFLGRWYIIVPLALIVLAAIIGFWYYPSLQIAYHQARNERVLSAKLEAVKAYNAQLEDEVKSLETTPGVAAYARRELNLVDKGDHVVIVTRDGKPVTSAETSKVTALENLTTVKQPFGAWTDFLDRLFGAE